MKITNTYYKLPPRRFYTWKAPGDRPDNIIRNQIDYILINKRYGTWVKRVCLSGRRCALRPCSPDDGNQNQNYDKTDPCTTAKDTLRKS